MWKCWDATMAALPPPRSPGAFLAKENARWSEPVKSAGVTVESRHGARLERALNPL